MHEVWPARRKATRSPSVTDVPSKVSSLLTPVKIDVGCSRTSGGEGGDEGGGDGGDGGGGVGGSGGGGDGKVAPSQRTGSRQSQFASFQRPLPVHEVYISKHCWPPQQLFGWLWYQLTYCWLKGTLPMEKISPLSQTHRCSVAGRKAASQTEPAPAARATANTAAF